MLKFRFAGNKQTQTFRETFVFGRFFRPQVYVPAQEGIAAGGGVSVRSFGKKRLDGMVRAGSASPRPRHRCVSRTVPLSLLHKPVQLTRALPDIII